MKVLVARDGGTRKHASRECPSIRSARVDEYEEEQLGRGMKRCESPTCTSAFDAESKPREEA